MHHTQFFSYCILLIFGITIVIATGSIQVSASTPSLQSNDLGIIAEVEVSNPSIYYLSGDLNISINSFNPITSLNSPNNSNNQQIRLLFTLPEVRVVTGSNTYLLYAYFMNQLFNEYRSNKFTTNQLHPLATSIDSSLTVPTIYDLSPIGLHFLSSLSDLSFNAKGRYNLAHLDPYHSFLLQSISSNNNLNNISSVNSFAQLLSSSVNTSSFNAVGHNGMDSEHFKTGDVLGAGNLSTDSLNSANFTNSLDTHYSQLAQQDGLINSDDSIANNKISTQSLVGNTQVSNQYTVLTSGYTNFNTQAVVDPIIKYTVSLYADNGTQINPDYLFVNYTSVKSASVSQFESSNLKDIIRSSLNSPGFGHSLLNVYSTINLFGLSLFSDHSYHSLDQTNSTNTTTPSTTSSSSSSFATSCSTCNGSQPLLKLDEFTAYSQATTYSEMTSISNNVNNITNIQDDTGIGFLESLFTNSMYSLNTLLNGSLVTHDVLNVVTNLGQATDNTVTQSLAILSTFNLASVSFAPVLLAGICALAIILFYLLTKKKLF